MEILMRAFAQTDADAAPELTKLDVPSPAEGEVLVRVHAASVNGFDLAVAAGLTKAYMEHRYPLVLGKDFAGVIDEVGPGVSDYATGDRVFGVVTKPYLKDGSFADYVTVPTAVGLAKLPDQVSFTEGAALGLAGAAAHAILEAAQIQPGQSVLVVGATGGVGTQVVQLAVAAGAAVLATTHTDAERELVTRLGATSALDYTDDLLTQVRETAPDGVDAVIHLAGDTTPLAAARDGGRFISTLIGSPDQIPSDSVTVVPVYANPTTEVLDAVAAGHAAGRTTVTVQKTVPLDHAQDAFDLFAAGTIGKLVITTD
jgi:NADPH:quinone reductase-like Zn-dependent oxidoreductase